MGVEVVSLRRGEALRLGKNSLAAWSSRKFFPVGDQDTGKILPQSRFGPTERILFYLLEKQTNSCSASLRRPRTAACVGKGEASAPPLRSLAEQGEQARDELALAGKNAAQRLVG